MNTRRKSLLLAVMVTLVSDLVALGGEPAKPGAAIDVQTNISFPQCAQVVDVTKPPYHAKGDGQHDDTDAIQRALADVMGQRKVLYFPNGVYLVSKPLRWSKKNANGSDAWGFNTLQGQNAFKTIIRLKDKTFVDAKQPQAIMWCGGFGSADWFHNYVQDITFDVGSGNPGAIGLQFYTNNTGAVRNLRVVSRDGQGAVGLDFGAADMNGPLIAKNVEVKGFEIGIRSAAVVNSQTLEAVTLEGQTKFALANFGQSVSVRRLLSRNDVPAIKADGFMVVIDSLLKGTGKARQSAAILVGGAPFLAKNVETAGYAQAIDVENGKRVERGPKVVEFVQGKPTALFGGATGSLGLEVRETPSVAADPPSSWAIVDKFGADPSGERDSSDAIQRAIDSGAATVFFPGSYNLTKPVRVRGKVRRLLGIGGWIDYNHHSKPDLILEDGSAPMLLIEHFAPINGGISVESRRPLIMKSVEASLIMKQPADLYLEDCGMNDLRLLPGQKAWARQLNIENEGTHLTNNGGSLWVMGYKTERGGTLLKTTGGGKSELLGNFSYTTTAGKLAPMFVTEDASVYAFFNEVCYSGDPFAVLIEETRKGTKKVVKRGEGWIAPYVSRP